MDESNIGKKIVFGTWATVILVLALCGTLGSWFLIDQGERGVVLRNGAFVRVAEPGLGFKMPIIDSVNHLSVRTEKQVYDKLTSYSRDIQTADIRVAINYRLDVSAVRQVYEQYGSRQAAVDRILTPRVQDEVKVVFGRFNAKTAIEERGRLGVEMEDALRTSLKGVGIVLESIQLENVDFSDAFDKSIEERMKAEVEVTRLEQNLKREKVQADIVRTQANGQADAIRAKAQAESDAIKLRGNAEATAIRARADALKSDPALIELVKAEKWDGKLPVTMIPGQSVPLIGIGGVNK